MNTLAEPWAAAAHSTDPLQAMPEAATAMPHSPPSNGAKILIATLLELGVDTVFGYPGGAVLPLYDALVGAPGLRHVLVRHEQAAVHAAQGYARSTGKVGVVWVTSGPGMSNTTTGLLDALCDSIPVLCISGQVATRAIGTDAFQECDALGISRPVTRWNAQVQRVQDLSATLRHAYAVARGGRPGPVLVDVPKDVQLATLTPDDVGSLSPRWAMVPSQLRSAVRMANSNHQEPTPAALVRVEPFDKLRANGFCGQASTAETIDPEVPVLPAPELLGQVQRTPVTVEVAAQRAAVLLAQAERPVVYGGGGLVNAGTAACALLAQLVRALHAPCTLTLMGLGAFPASDARWVGMLGMHGSLAANLAMHHADVVLCVGARFDDRVTGELQHFCPGARVIHLDIDPCSVHKVVPAEVALVGDCTLGLRALLQPLQALLPTPSGERLAAWWARIRQWQRTQVLAEETAAMGPSTTPQPILPQQLLRTLNTQLQGRNAIVSTDVGQHQMWAAQHLGFDTPRRWLTSGGAGTMGYGLPAAIGAQVAYPEALVVCVSGDASILMNIQEMATARQHGAGVKVVLCNNGAMGMVRQWQELFHGGRYSQSYFDTLPDFVALALAFGWQSARVERPEDLGAALATCLASDGPYLLDVVVKTEENCYPMVAAGSGHHQVWLNAETRFEG